MTPRPFDAELSLRRHGASLRQLAAELLRDPGSADDAVQEVWLGALRRPPRHEGSVGGWLATALRNVARRLRRGEARRARRESIVARVNEVEDHATVLAREELLHRLVAAVSALEPPYREAVWRRYFEGMPPREIARASGVPLATVKSRLQRGLQQLREQLREEGESGWRGALAVAFGLKDSAVPAGTGCVAATWPGVLLVTAWTKSVAAVAVVAIAGVLLWSLREPSVAMPGAGVATAVPGVLTAGGDAQAAAKSEVAAAATGVERSELTAGAAQPAKNATLRGRCVDANAVPLAGCKVSLLGSRAGQMQMDAWLLDHDPPGWQDPPMQETGADGEFSFAFAPPPPFQFYVSVSRDGFVTMGGSWRAIPERANVDVGDVVMQPGVLVRGRLVDPSGQPVGDVQIDERSLTAPLVREIEEGHLSPSTYWAARTDVDGRFAFRAPLPLGAYQLKVSDGFMVKNPDPLDLVAERTVEDLLVVVEEPKGPVITGKVVDEADQPVRNARIGWTPGGNSLVDGASSKRDGTFILRGNDGHAAGEVHIVAEANGYEGLRLAEPVRWGTKDLVLRLVRAGVLTVRVTDPQGLPISTFTVRVVPRDSLQWVSPEITSIRARGPFDNGTANVTGVVRGSHYIVVEYPNSSGFQPTLQSIEVDARSMRLDLRAGAEATRTLRVRFADGEPVPATRVQLCELLGGTIDERTFVMERGSWFLLNGGKRVLVLDEGTTDAEGRFVLCGPRDRPVGLRVLGPGHPPIGLSDVRLDAGSELVVTVRAGARIHGKVVPPEAMVELRRLAGVDTGGTFPLERRPSLRLWREGGVMVPNPLVARDSLEKAAFLIADDGSFDVGGVPPGPWQVQVVSWRVQKDLARTTSLAVANFIAADGLTEELAIDLQTILPGTIEGEVTLNGRPLGNTRVGLEPAHATTTNGRAAEESAYLETDDQGRFTQKVPPGTYSLTIHHRSDRQAWLRLQASTMATVVRGETTRHTFALVAGTLKLRVIDAAGKPAANVEVVGQPENVRLSRTGADGTTTAELAAQTITLRVLPKRLQSPEAQMKLRNEAHAAGQTDPLAPYWLTLGTATIDTGQTTTLELRLPPEWEQ
ncbi:MAG TPA: sigma-70 family RNA polymerase sigma factor [Planctomycetota bacterium]|nr:sigma-70 family RNA polymerase sigma factor [Planctomycetota bacterium]